MDCVTIWLINSPDPSLIRTAGGEGRSGTNHGNYRITTASLYPLTLSYPKDIIQGMFGFDGRKSGPCLWFSIAKLLLSAENTNAGKKVNHVVNILKENNLFLLKINSGSQVSFRKEMFLAASLLRLDTPIN